jgi:hypothetical protein
MNDEALQKWCKGASLYAEKVIDVERIKGQYIEMFSWRRTVGI